MQAATKGPKEGFIRIGLGIVRTEGIRGIYHGVGVPILMLSSINLSNQR
jgi:hypothetical protein